MGLELWEQMGRNMAAKKTTDHNGKEIKKMNGKNIRVSESGWNKIRRYCQKNTLVMGAFVEKAAIDQIEEDKLMRSLK